MVVASQVVQLF